MSKYNGRLIEVAVVLSIYVTVTSGIIDSLGHLNQEWVMHVSWRGCRLSNRHEGRAVFAIVRLAQVVGQLAKVWDKRQLSLRWNAKHGPAFPPHTSSGTGRHPGLLHLDLQVHEARHDILFADAPGEWFSRWAVRREAEEAIGALWLSEASDVLIVVADSDALAGPRLGVARTNLVALLRRVGAERRGRPVAVVWTKCDVKVNDQMLQAVTHAADLALGSYRTFSVSMHSAPGQEPHNRGHGLIELFEWALSVREGPFHRPAGREPERELLRQVGGVGA
jgi:hypothetical protein